MAILTAAVAIIGDGDRKSWDPRPPLIWDNFFYFYAHAKGSRVDVVTFGDQMVRAARFSCGYFTAMTGGRAGN